MHSTRSILILAAAAAVLGGIPAAAQKIKVTTQTVPIYATVTDSERRLVGDLLQEDFEVYDNGKLQPLTNFDNTPTPIAVVVMLDTSGSMTLNLEMVKQGAEQFLLRLLPEDIGRVGAFNDKIDFHPPEGFTSDRDALIAELKHLDFGYPTRLYDAIEASIDQLHSFEQRKVVIAFTDGDDTASKAGMGDVLELARAQDAMIYSIGLESDYFNGQQRVRTRPDRGLKKLSEETGGGFFELKKTDELGPTFTRVAQELHSQYVLGFSPTALDGKVHKLEVKVKRPGMSVRGRKSYVAAPAGTTDKQQR